MNLLELAQKRCSIRKYASSPVEDEKLAYILEAGRMAPSAVNFQPWYFVIIRQEAGRTKIQELAHIRMDFRGIMQSAWTRKG